MAKKSKIKIPESVSSKVFDVDISEILDSLDAMDSIPSFIMDDIADEVDVIARSLLRQVFEEAIDKQSEEGFPQEFRDHVMEVIGFMDVDRVVGQGHAEIFVDFNQLGTLNDLTKAFHQGAKLAEGGIVDGPYEGEALLNPVDERHEFWLAVRTGTRSVPNVKGHGKIPIKEGAWEETKRKYVEIWGDKAPEWLYLQFGQDKWEPHIRASSIVEDFSARFQQQANEVWQRRLSQAVEDAQRGSARLIKNTSEIGPSGKPRKAGQFYFKNRG